MSEPRAPVGLVPRFKEFKAEAAELLPCRPSGRVPEVVMAQAARRLHRSLIREDLAAHEGKLRSPGFQALLVHRFGAWRDALPHGLSRRLLRVPYEFARRSIRSRYRIEVHHTAVIGRRVRLSPHGEIVIGNACMIGDDSVIAAGVTMAKTKVGRPGRPVVGDRVIIGPGAALVGGVRIGDGAVLGPNIVAFADVPPDTCMLPPKAHVSPAAREQDDRRYERHGEFRPADPRRLPDDVSIGREVLVARSGMPTFEGAVRVDDGCVLGGRVTIGWQPPYDPRPETAVTSLGKRVVLSVGSVVLRGVSIGDDVHVGPNAVVEADIPSGAVVSSPPVRVFAAIRQPSKRLSEDGEA